VRRSSSSATGSASTPRWPTGAAVTVEQLAARTGTTEAYLRPWLANQAAGGYVEYDATTGTWSMTPEQIAVLADQSSPAFFPGSMQLALGALRDTRAVEERFRTGAGLGWHEHDADVFEGTERFFRPGYVANLVPLWLPSLDGVVARLEAGATVADVGCGHGASAILMAQAFPASTFHGFDTHAASIETAQRRAAEAGVADRVDFMLSAADGYPGEGYDLVCFFDALHDMGDPAGAARHARHALAPDGTALIVEPYANDRIEENLNPVGRFYYGMSTLLCTPGALAQPGGVALGTQAGEARLTEVLQAGGFTRVRRAAETPLNLILEARP
jgi:SAM-dependent methyltransferase